MSDNYLKKEFKLKDVNRLRNLVTGNSDKSTQVGVGYEKSYIERSEGEIWEEDGRKWTIKNGIKQNIPKNPIGNNIPLFCPECKQIMNNPYDKNFYTLHGRCFNCQVSFETKLKIQNKWEEYEQQIINSDIDNLIKDYSNWIDDEIQKTTNSYITERGEEEVWMGDIKGRLLEEKENTINFLNNLRNKNGRNC